MSYILEALKKAERQRDIGLVPGIDSAHEQTPASASRRWFWLVVLALGVNTVLLTVLLKPKPEAEHLAQSSVEHTPPVQAPRSVVPSPKRPDAIVRSVQKPVKQPAAETPPVAEVNKPVLAAVLPGQPEPVPPSGRVEKAEVLPDQPGVPSPPGQVQKPAALPEPQQVVQAPGKVDKVAALPQPQEVVEPPPQVAKAATPLLPVWPQIPSHLFSQLQGGLKLDVHVYGEQPEERFVLINLKKYLEGEQLQEGPQLDEITREGVILSFKGQRFQMQAQ